MYIFESAQYNNITEGVGIYSIGQPLLIDCYSDDYPTYPVYVTISDTNGNSISNLEMCKVKFYATNEWINLNVIDIAPFVRTLFDTAELFSTTLTSLKYLTITLTNYKDDDIVINSYFINQFATVGNTPQLIDQDKWTSQAAGYPSKVYKGDVAVNDVSPIILPEDIDIYFNQPIYSLQSGYTINTVQNNYLVADTATVLPVNKNNSTVTQIAKRKIIRKPFCNKNTIMLAYLNKHGYFEYFIFDRNYTVTTEVEKEDRVYNTLHNNTYNTFGNIYGGTETNTYTAVSVLRDNDEYNKFRELITSNRAYMFKNVIDSTITSVNNSANWIEVDIDASANYLSKRTNKVSCNIVIKNNYYI